MRRRRSRQLVVASATLAVAATTWAAAVRSWDPQGTVPPVGGAGSWDLSTLQWWDGSGLRAWDNGSNDTALFSGNGATVTVAAPVSAGGLEFDTGGYQLSAGTGGALTLTGTAPEINVANASDSDTLALPLTATSLNKTGAGTLTLYVAGSPSMLSNVTGSISASAGTLILTPGFAQPLVLNNALRGSGNIAFTGGGVLNLGGSGDFTGQFLDNGFSLRLNSNEAIGNASLLAIGTSVKYLGTDRNVTIASPVRLDGSAQIAFGNPTPFVPQLTLSGDISGTGNLTVNGLNLDGVLHLSGNNSAWSGNLKVLGGTADLPVVSMPSGNIAVGPATNATSVTFLSRGSLTRSIGMGTGQIQFIEAQPPVGNSPKGAYLGAQGGPLDVNFGGNAVPSTVSFASTPGFAPLGALRLGGGDNTVTIRNPIDLGTSGTGGDRVVEVKSSTAILSGAISGASQWNLVKQGPGTLVLSGANTFSGDLIPEGGALEVGSPAALPPNASLRFRYLGATLRVGDGVTTQLADISYPDPGVNFGDTTARLVTTSPTGTLSLGSINFPKWGPAGNIGRINLSGNIDLGSADHSFFIGGDFKNQMNSVVSNATFRGTGRIFLTGGGILDLSGNSTFSGPIYSDSVLWIRGNSVGAPGNVTAGPVGTGTLILQGGAVYGDPAANGGQPPRITNPVNFTQSALNADDIEFSGPLTNPDIAVPAVNSLGVILSGPITGEFSSAGPGLVTLSGDNSGMTQQMYIGGDVRAISPHALGTNLPISVGAGSTLEITGTMGGQWLDLSGTPTSPAILRNVQFASATWTAPVDLVGRGELLGDGPTPFTLTQPVQDITVDHVGELDIVGSVTVPQIIAPTLNVFGHLKIAKTGPGSTRISSLVLTGQSTIDLTDQILDVSYDTTSPAPSITALIRSAYNGGSWNGSGIFSSLADASHFALGYADSADGVVSPLRANTFRVKFTRYGDANLNGTVDFSDLLLLAQHYGKAAATWDQGDFNYDGTVNFTDLLQLAQNYGGSLNAAEAMTQAETIGAEIPGAIQSVPEPVAAVALAALGMLLPRRRIETKAPAAAPSPRD